MEIVFDLIFQVAKNSSMYISRARKDSSIHAISFLTPSSAAAGWRFTADFYCPDTEKDPLVLVAHVLRHLEEMATAKDVQHIWLTITYPKSYPGTSSKHQVLTDLKDMNHRSGSKMWDGSLFVVSVDNDEMEKHMIGKARLWCRMWKIYARFNYVLLLFILLDIIQCGANIELPICWPRFLVLGQSHDTCVTMKWSRTWWRHQMGKFSALLAICAVTGDFPTQRPVTRSFGVFFDLSLNKRLSK